MVNFTENQYEYQVIHFYILWKVMKKIRQKEASQNVTRYRNNKIILYFELFCILKNCSLCARVLLGWVLDAFIYNKRIHLYHKSIKKYNIISSGAIFLKMRIFDNTVKSRYCLRINPLIVFFLNFIRLQHFNTDLFIPW